MIAGGSAAVIASIGLSGLGLFAIGAAITILLPGVTVPALREPTTRASAWELPVVTFL